MNRAHLSTLLAIALLSPLALAQPSPAEKAIADSLFEEGKRLSRDGSHAEACTKFEESQKLDPAVGTLLYLASCYEKVGRTASAWTTFREAASTARSAGQADREKTAQARAEALEARLTKLKISVPKENEVPGIELRRNGAPVPRALWGVAFAIDPGKQKLEASAPGHAPWRKELDVTGGTEAILIPRLTASAGAPAASASVAPSPSTAAPPPGPAPAPTEVSAGSNRKTFALVAGGVGLLGLGVGSYFGLQAFSRWDESRDGCNQQNQCSPAGKASIQDARSAATLSTVFFAVGAVGLGAGAVLWLTAPEKEPRVGLSLSPNHLSLQGRW